MIRIRPYRPEDEPALQRLAARPMPGWVRLRYAYINGYAAGEGLKGDRIEILVGEDREHTGILACGTRSSRCLWFNGQPQRIGYLSGLRNLPDTRNGFCLARGCRLLRQRMIEQPLPCTYTTILADNRNAQVLLTSGRAGLPRYTPHGKVITWAIAGRGGNAERDEIPSDALREFYARESPRRQLFPVFEAGFHPSLTQNDFIAVYRHGRIVAAGALWRHGDYRRLFIDGYRNPLVAVARIPLNGWARWTGRSILPRSGAELRCVYLAYALAENDDPALFSELVAMAASRTGGDNLVLALHDSDPLCRILEHRAAWRYESAFMTVSYDEPARQLNGVPHIEAGAL